MGPIRPRYGPNSKFAPEPSVERGGIMIFMVPNTQRFACGVLLLLALALTLAAQQPQADTIYYNGHFVTMWDGHPAAEAVAIRGNRFLAVGTLAEVARAANPAARRIDLHGRTILPGL